MGGVGLTLIVQMTHLLSTFCVPGFVLSALHFTDKAPNAEAICPWTQSW